jgi:hypothetical protein
VLERLAQLIVIPALACNECSAQNSVEQQGTSGTPAAAFVNDPNQAGIAHSLREGAAEREAICPEVGGEAPQSPGSPLWLQSYDSTEITSTVTDSRGNVVLARSGVELTKLSCSGAPLWTKPFGSQVAVDAQDRVYVAGTFTDTLSVDGRVLRGPGTQAFLAKLDPDGSVVQLLALGEAAGGAIDSLAVDRDQNVAVAGPGLGTVKVDSAGRVLWQKAWTGKLRFDRAGNLHLTGELVGAFDFGTGTLSSRGGSDVLLLKLAPDGTTVFAGNFGDAGALQRGEAIAVDDQDNVVVTGTFDGRLDFGAGALELTPSRCSSDAWCVTDGFVAKLDARGQVLWNVALGPMRSLPGVALDASGDVVISGALPGGVRPFRQTLVAKLAADGTEQWRRAEWPDTGIGAGHGVAVDPSGYVFWAISARPSLAGEEQSYLAKLAP